MSFITWNEVGNVVADLKERVEALEANAKKEAEEMTKAGPFSEMTAREPCLGCGAPLLLQNAWMADGCPCNSKLGCNDSNAHRWRLLIELLIELQKEQSVEISSLRSELSRHKAAYQFLLTQRDDERHGQTANKASSERLAGYEQCRSDCLRIINEISERPPYTYLDGNLVDGKRAKEKALQDAAIAIQRLGVYETIDDCLEHRPRSLTVSRVNSFLPEMSLDPEWERKCDAGELPDGPRGMEGMFKLDWPDEKPTREEAEWILAMEKLVTWRQVASYATQGEDDNQITGIHLISAAKEAIAREAQPNNVPPDVDNETKRI